MNLILMIIKSLQEEFYTLLLCFFSLVLEDIYGVKNSTAGKGFEMFIKDGPWWVQIRKRQARFLITEIKMHIKMAEKKLHANILLAFNFYR